MATINNFTTKNGKIQHAHLTLTKREIQVLLDAFCTYEGCAEEIFDDSIDRRTYNRLVGFFRSAYAQMRVNVIDFESILS